MHPRRTADVAFPKRTFALRNCGQSSSGTVCLSVSFYIACYGWAKIDGEKQTLSVATCSPGHLLRLSWPWLPQETGSILCTTVPRLDPSPWRPRDHVLLGLHHRAGAPEPCLWHHLRLPSSLLLQYSVLRARLCSQQCLICWIRTPRTDSDLGFGD